MATVRPLVLSLCPPPAEDGPMPPVLGLQRAEALGPLASSPKQLSGGSFLPSRHVASQPFARGNPPPSVCPCSLAEAQAYAKLHGARLLTEPEWQLAMDSKAAAACALRQLDSGGWEWTATPFAPLPGEGTLARGRLVVGPQGGCVKGTEQPQEAPQELAHQGSMHALLSMTSKAVVACTAPGQQWQALPGLHQASQPSS